jgi:hypothetical protein
MILYNNSKCTSLERQICLPLRNRNFGVEDATPRTYFSAEDGDPNKTLEDWANAFGGRLSVDGMVCYDKGTLVRSAFVPDPWLPKDPPSDYLLRTDVNICRLGELFLEAKREDMMACRNNEEIFYKIYWTHPVDLLDDLCRDWEITSFWSIEERMKMVEERTREYNQRNAN